jgi:hypothetical protein
VKVVRAKRFGAFPECLQDIVMGVIIYGIYNYTDGSYNYSSGRYNYRYGSLLMGVMVLVWDFSV